MTSKKILLTISGNQYELDVVDNSTSQEIIGNLPIKGKVRNIGGEIYFSINLDIPFNAEEMEVFDIGDVVYWRSQKEEKFAIAIFYGNTKFGEGNAPMAASSCVKFATIKQIEVDQLREVENDRDVVISIV